MLALARLWGVPETNVREGFVEARRVRDERAKQAEVEAEPEPDVNRWRRMWYQKPGQKFLVKPQPLEESKAEDTKDF
jgi:hypothetical protein